MGVPSLKLVSIQYTKGRQFEIDNSYPLPTYILVQLVGGVYTLLVPEYCIDSASGKMTNVIMWSLYPQYSHYDFESGQV